MFKLALINTNKVLVSMFKYFHFGTLSIARYAFWSFAAVLKTILQVMDYSLFSSTVIITLKTIWIFQRLRIHWPQRNWCPFLLTLVIFSAKRRGRIHMQIRTTKVHICSLPRSDQNFSLIIYIKISHHRFHFINHLGFLLIMTFISNQKFQEFLEHMLALYAPLHIL